MQLVFIKGLKFCRYIRCYKVPVWTPANQNASTRQTHWNTLCSKTHHLNRHMSTTISRHFCHCDKVVLTRPLIPELLARLPDISEDNRDFKLGASS